MAPGTQILLSGALTFGAPLVLAVMELVNARRHRGGGGFRPPEPEPTPPPPKSLPDCLIPKPGWTPERPKVRELA
jgi:hypothetical protein